MDPAAHPAIARATWLRARLSIVEEDATIAAHQAYNLWACDMPDDAREQELREAQADYEAALIRAELEALERSVGAQPPVGTPASPPERAPARPAVLTVPEAARMLRRRRAPAEAWLRERGLIVDIMGEARVLRSALQAAMRPPRAARTPDHPRRPDDKLFVLAPR